MGACLRASKVEVYMLCKYVDDINLATQIIPPGYYWEEVQNGKGRQLVFSEEREKRDKESSQSQEERTILLITEEASRKIPGIKFTYDLPEKHTDRKCPVLDLAMWTEKVEADKPRIRFTFFEKEVTAPTVFHSQAAYNWRSKIITLSEEMR